MGNIKNLAFWVVLFMLILALFNLFSNGQRATSTNAMTYSEFVTAVSDGTVQSVTLDGEDIKIHSKDGYDFTAIKPGDADVTQMLIEHGVEVRAIK